MIIGSELQDKIADEIADKIANTIADKIKKNCDENSVCNNKPDLEILQDALKQIEIKIISEKMLETDPDYVNLKKIQSELQNDIILLKKQNLQQGGYRYKYNKYLHKISSLK